MFAGRGVKPGRTVHAIAMAIALAGFAVPSYLQAQTVTFRTSNIVLEQAFAWARYRALSYAHYGADPVGSWYEAALPNREAFCMRDVSHQAIGAEILGLGKHNENMFRKFAANISAEKDYCSYWEINRHNKPAPADYATDKDFWYNLPANFDLIYNAWRLYQWTGNLAYLQDPQLKNFYALSTKEYVDRWELDGARLRTRNRLMFAGAAKQFKSNRGIPTYNEGGRGEARAGIDLSASLIAAYEAYAKMLGTSNEKGDKEKAETMREKAAGERKFLSEFWWDTDQGEFRSIWYADNTFDHFMVGDNQAYLHYALYFDALEDSSRAHAIIGRYAENHNELITELKSYLPQLFYEYGKFSLANQLIVSLCSPSNKRRDYPENAFTVIEDITRGYMGIEPNAADQSISTLSRLESPTDWAELARVPALGTRITVRHNGQVSSSIENLGTQPLTWRACFYGDYEMLEVNGKRVNCSRGSSHGLRISWVDVTVPAKKAYSVSVD